MSNVMTTSKRGTRVSRMNSGRLPSFGSELGGDRSSLSLTLPWSRKQPADWLSYDAIISFAQFGR